MPFLKDRISLIRFNFCCCKLPGGQGPKVPRQARTHNLRSSVRLCPVGFAPLRSSAFGDDDALFIGSWGLFLCLAVPLRLCLGRGFGFASVCLPRRLLSAGVCFFGSVTQFAGFCMGLEIPEDTRRLLTRLKTLIVLFRPKLSQILKPHVPFRVFLCDLRVIHGRADRVKGNATHKHFK